MKLLGSTKSKIIKNEHGKNLPQLKITEAVLVHCNIVSSNYQQNSRVFHIFVFNKSFGQLLDISPKNFINSKTFNSEFSYIKVWFTIKNSKLLQIEDKLNIIFVIIKVLDRILVKDYGFLYFARNMDKNINKNLNRKQSKKLLDLAKQSATDTLKTASKRAIEKATEATGDLIGDKTPNKITRASETSPQNNSVANEEKIFRERYLSPEERWKIIDDLRLI